MDHLPISVSYTFNSLDDSSFIQTLLGDLTVFSLSDKNTLDNGHIVLSIYLSTWFIPFC